MIILFIAIPVMLYTAGGKKMEEYNLNNLPQKEKEKLIQAQLREDYERVKKAAEEQEGDS